MRQFPYKTRQRAIMAAGMGIALMIGALAALTPSTGAAMATCQQSHSVDVCAYALR